MGKDRIESARRDGRDSAGTSALGEIRARARVGMGLGKFSEIKRLGSTIDCMLASGDAILLGVTKDRTATLVRVYSGGSSEDTYCGGQAQLNDMLAALAEIYGDGLELARTPLPPT